MARRSLLLCVLMLALIAPHASGQDDGSGETVETSHPTALSTRVRVSQPTCRGRQAIVLAQFCAAPTPAEMESYPDSLPRISVEVQPVAPAQVRHPAQPRKEGMISCLFRIESRVHI